MEGKMSLVSRLKALVRPFPLAAGLVLSCSIASPTQAQAPSPALLVLEKEDQTVAIVDPASLQVVGRVAAGGDPHEICVTRDGRTAYISNYGAFSTPLHTLSVVDLVARKPLPPVDLGVLRAPHGLEEAGGKIYFTAEGSKAIGRYDPASGRVDWVLGVGQDRTHMLAVSRDLRTVFTSDVNADAVSVLERDEHGDVSGWRETRIPVGRGPEGFDVSPDGSELWAANSQDGTVSIVDLASRKVTRTLEVQAKRANRLKFTPDGRLVLVSDLETGDLVVVDARARLLTKRINLGKGAAGILIPDASRAFVAVSRDNAVAVLDLATLSVTGRIVTGRGPDGMAWTVRTP
jgi:YVTN family beta-propeller protein